MAFEELTTEEIKEKLITNITALEATFTALASFTNYSRIRNIVFAMTTLLDEVQQLLRIMYDNGWISTADEEGLQRWLDDKGMSWGEATQATVTLYIGSKTLPTSNVDIPQLFQASTKDATPIVFETVESGQITPATPADGKGYYTVGLSARAVEAGLSGNVAAETIIDISTEISGIDVVYNSVSSTGGTDREDIESVRNRLLTQEKVYDRWTTSWILAQATSFSFVSSVFIYPSRYGNGSVALLLAGSGYISDAQLQEVEDHFNDTEINDVGAVVVYVSRSEQVTVNITITVYRKDTGVTNATVTASIESYFNTLVVDEDVIVNRIEAVVNEDTGVYDCTVSVPAANVVVDDGKIGTVGTLGITLVTVSTE